MTKGLVTENQQTVTFMMKQTADMIMLLTSKNPGNYLYNAESKQSFPNYIISKYHPFKDLEM